jgi:hypothetical protein
MKDTFNTVDFCSTPDCIAHRVMRDDMQKAHLPHHDLMKVRRVLHTRLFGKTYRDAKKALKLARTFFKPGAMAGAEQNSEARADTEGEDGHAPVSAMPLSAKRLSRIPALAISIPQGAQLRGPGSGYPKSALSAARSPLLNPAASGPSCCACKKPVSQPCWYCVQCGDASFICWECDINGEVSFGNHDFHTHDLVRVQEVVDEKDLSMEERLVELEERFSKHEKAMDSRMDRMEALLEQVLKKIVTT